MRIQKNRRREMVRFGYRKVSMVAPWKVEESRQVRGKEASSVGRSLQGSSPENDDLDEGKASKNAEKKTSQHYFPPGQPEIILRHAEELKMTLVCEKGKADLEDLAILPTQQHQFPKASHPTASSAPTPPTGGDEDITAGQRNTPKQQQRGRSTSQSPASVASSCQATSMCSCSCRRDGSGRRNRRTKRTFSNRLRVPGR